MDKNRIPENLHHLIPYVNEWGIGDDGYRDEKIYNATTDELKTLVDNFSDEDADNLNTWLINPELLKHPTDEYINFSNYFMAYEYAESILSKR